MHILLTDRLACPRCGPGFGLILLADQIADRRVLEGRLGCPNCREQYPVRGGLVDLRTGPSVDEGVSTIGPDDAEAAVKYAALLGLHDNPGPVLLAGPASALARAVAALVPNVEVVALSARPSGEAETAGVSRLAGGPALPFMNASLRGAALTGGADGPLLADALRALVPGTRLVVDPAPEGTADALRGLGAEVLLDQQGVVVASVR